MSRLKSTPSKKRANLRAKRRRDSSSEIGFGDTTEKLAISSENKALRRLQAFGHALRRYWRSFCTHVGQIHRKNMRKLIKWLDPKFDKYRSKKKIADKLTSALENNQIQKQEQRDHGAKNLTERSQAIYTDSIVSEQEVVEPYTPRSISDFLAILGRTPHTVLSQHERQVISTIINFSSYRVSDLMLSADEIVYVREDEVLGPLTLDRLYRSGFSHFPVTDQKEKIVGLLHTTALNSLEIKDTSTAKDLLDPHVYYVRLDYDLNQVMAAFLRTNCYFFLVIDKFEHIVGLLTYQMLVNFLLGKTPRDNFDRDDDRLAVAKRRLDEEYNYQVSKNEKLRRVAEMQDEAWRLRP